MIIEKTSNRKLNSLKPICFFDSAREGLENILKLYADQKDVTFFIPAYIGVSPNEGSGIYDPIVKVGIDHVFYHITRDLSIDSLFLEEALKKTKGTKIVLLVHYFGYPDINIDSIVRICKENSAIIIEDAAHALYTDFIDHECGNYGDYVLYSLHKMLPLKKGGLLKINNLKIFSRLKISPEKRYPLFDYDLYEISLIRKRNAKIWYDLLKGHTDILNILRPFYNNVTPQTYPVVIKKYDRDKLYFELNKAGFGAVSLYHTMIKPIQKEEYKDSVWLSKHIINMPVHQDVSEKQIVKMANKIFELLE